MSVTQATGQPAPSSERVSAWMAVREFPRSAWFLFLGTFVNRFGTFVVPFLTLHITRLGYTTGEAGLAFGAYGAGHLLATVIGGNLADTLGRRRTIMLSMVGGAFCMMFLSQARALGSLVALAFCTGLMGEFYRPASSALLADLVPANRRVTAYAAYRFSINAGWAFGPAIAGLVAQQSYFWLFAGDAATSLLYGAIALLWLPRDGQVRTRGWAFARDAFVKLSAACRMAARDGGFLRLLAGSFAVGLVFMQMLVTLGLDLRAAGHSDEIYGLLLALNGVLIVLFEIPLTTFTQRLMPRTAIATGFALVGVGAGLYVWAEAPWHYACGMTVLTLGEMFAMPVAMAHVVNLAPPEMRGRYLGLYALTGAMAFTAGPGFGALLFSWHPAALWFGCGVTGLAAALLVLRPGRDSRFEIGAGGGT